MSAALTQIERAVSRLDSDENYAALRACLHFATLDDIVAALQSLPQHDIDEIAEALSQ